MARQKRAQSENGIYHVMLRGINKQQVFFNIDDYYMFLNILSKVKTISGFKLHAYCLMPNHVHLLIQEGEEPLSLVLKRIGNTFIYWYNAKYDRVGGIFQGRYKSVPVNDDEYFISVLRYIHKNPIKAGIVNNCEDYEFSSYKDYFKGNGFVNTGFALELIGINEFERIHNQEDNSNHLDIEDLPKIRLTDEEAKEVVKNKVFCDSAEEFQRVPFDMKKAYVKLLIKEGLSNRQITAFTGASRRMIDGQRNTD